MDFKVVKENGKYFYKGTDGKLYGEGYDDAWSFYEGYARVKKGGKWYYVDDKDFNLHGEGYDDADDFSEGYAPVEIYGKCYFVDKKDFKLHGEGFDKAFVFSEGYAEVKKGGVWYCINKDFQIDDEDSALRVAEQDIKKINEIAPKCFLNEGFAKALNEVIYKHNTQKIEEMVYSGLLKLKEEMEGPYKLIESKKQEAEKLKQAKTDAKETFDKQFGNPDDEKE